MKSSHIEQPIVRPFAYPEKQSALHCGDYRLESLAKRYGTPLYVYSADEIRNRFQLFAKAFAHRPHLICYSVKANPNLSILKLLAEQGSGFDIVSGGELERVLKVNKKAAHRVVFSGVGKTASEMDLALRAKILIFNVESAAEVALLAERAAKLRIRARVALRVNPDVFAETHPYISTGLREHKFGIDIGMARAVYKEMKQSRYLDPVGVSVHIGSQIRSADPFGAAMERVVQLVLELEADGIHIESVDAGGGLGVEYQGGEMRSGREEKVNYLAFDPAEEILRYARAIDAALGKLNVRLLLEPGRFIIAQAGALLAKVLYVKQNGAKRFVITDAGMNDLIRPALYQAHHEIVPVSRDSRPNGIVDVVGPVCETGDFFARDREIADLRPGELIAILDTGAYGMSLSSNYNSRPRPAEVLVRGRSAKLIRRRETMRDQLAPEQGLL